MTRIFMNVETETDVPTVTRLVLPVLIAAVTVLVLTIFSIGLSIVQVNTAAIERERAFVESISAQIESGDPHRVVAALTQAKFANARQILRPEDAKNDTIVALVSADGLRTGLIAYTPYTLGSAIFSTTFTYKVSILGCAFIFLGFTIMQLRRRARVIECNRQTAHHLALTDPLSGLPNRRQFDNHLHKTLDQSRPYNTEASLFFIDLDGFKNINDRFGHAAGDTLIRLTSDRLSAALPEGGMVARLSGDEFAIIRQDIISDAQAESYGKLLVHLMEAPFKIDTLNIRISASVGVARTKLGDNLPAGDFCRNADKALYAAKAAGRNCARLYQFYFAHSPTSHDTQKWHFDTDDSGTDLSALM